MLCLPSRPATIHFSTIRYISRYSCHDTMHDTIRVLLVGSDICTADKPSWKHAYIVVPTILDITLQILLSRPATIHFSTIRYASRYSCHDTLHNNKTRRVLPRVLLVGSEVCTADKPSWKHACVCCVRRIEYNAKHCSAWIFLVSLFGKSQCRRTKKRKEGGH